MCLMYHQQHMSRRCRSNPVSCRLFRSMDRIEHSASINAVRTLVCWVLFWHSGFNSTRMSKWSVQFLNCNCLLLMPRRLLLCSWCYDSVSHRHLLSSWFIQCCSVSIWRLMHLCEVRSSPLLPSWFILRRQ